MTDYANTIIYMIACKDSDVNHIYVGHTIEFMHRYEQHRRACEDNKVQYKLYQIIRKYGGWDNWDMVIIEKYPCNNKEEACKQERFWIDQLNADLNTYCPYKSPEEVAKWRTEYMQDYNKKYYELNKDNLIKQSKLYQQTEYAKNRRNSKFTCEVCGGKYSRKHKAEHEKTKKHQKCLLNSSVLTKHSPEEVTKQSPEDIQEDTQKYDQLNKESILERSKFQQTESYQQVSKFTCEVCGGKYSRKHKAQHEKTKKHQKCLLNSSVVHEPFFVFCLFYSFCMQNRN